MFHDRKEKGEIGEAALVPREEMIPDYMRVVFLSSTRKLTSGIISVGVLLTPEIL